MKAPNTFQRSTIAIFIAGVFAAQSAWAETTICSDANSCIVNVNTDDGSIGGFMVVNGTATQTTTFNSEKNFTTITAGANSLTVNNTTGITAVGGINNSSGGITNAGAISGATTINASGTITGGNLSTAGTVTGATGTFTTLSGTTLGGTLNANGNNITNVGTIGATTGNITTLNSTTINNSGTTNTGALSVTNNAGIGGNLTVTGTSTLNGATAINNTLTVNSGAGATELAVGTNTVDINATTNVTGTTNINTTGSAATTIGSNTNTSTVRLESGTSSIQTSNGANSIIGNTNTVIGVTNINVNNNAATNINTGTTASDVTIGGSANVTNLNSATNNIGVSGTYATVNNIGTNAAFTSTNTIGNTNAGSSVNAYAGNSSLTMVNGSASLKSGAGSGYTAYSAPQTVVGATLVNGDAASRALVNGAQITNAILGNTLVDGNMYINGTLVYSSNSSATTTVTSGASILPSPTQATNGQMTIVNIGGSGARVDSNGQITNGIVTESTASLTLTNGYGNTHGLVVTERQSTLSGGINSTSLTLNDGGAFFSNSATGAPVRVTGVADGTTDFDAVNYRQLKQVAAGVAGASAMANIPQVDQNKTFSVGAGIGHFRGVTALALGTSYRMAPNAVLRASLSTSSHSSKKNTVYGVGAGFSW